MNFKLLLGLALVLNRGWFAAAQTNTLPAFYVHFGAEGERFLSTRIQLGEAIFVGAGDYWALKGHIEMQGTNFFGGLLGETGQQSQFYQGPMSLEKPCFAQGGAASGGAGPCFWFVISTNSDSRPIVQHIRMEFGFTNQPTNHLAVFVAPSPVVVTNVPKPLAPDDCLPQSPVLIDPNTGLPLRPNHDK